MDKWEKIVTLQRELTKNRQGCSLERLIDVLDCKNRSTVYRTKDWTELVFGVDIIRNKQTDKFQFDFRNGELTELPGLWFKKSELEALICLQQAMTSLQHGYLEEVLSPVQSRFEPLLKAQGIDIKAWKERFKILSIFTREVDNHVFQTIADAVLQSRKVYISYRKLGHKETVERIISPQTLIRYRDNWYVDSFCHLRNELRTFSLNRIQSAQKLKEKGENVPRKELDKHYEASFGIFSGEAKEIAEILFTGTAAIEVSQENWHPKQEGFWQRDSFWLKIPYGNSTELIMDVLKWGSEAEVVRPESFREEIAEVLKKMVKKYNG